MSLSAVVAGAAVPVALLLSGLQVWQSSYAAFTTQANGTATWTAGTVTITDDAPGSTLFTATDILPGDSGNRCVTVTFAGSADSDVRLYATASGALGTDLQLTVEQGTLAGADCSNDFTADSGAPVSSGTLSAFATAAFDYASGYGVWTPAALSGATKVYRLTWTLDPATPTSSQGASASATFTWESRNV